jgi:hypothetical protein
VVAALTLLLAACGASSPGSSLSGDYLARGNGFAEFIQLTQGQQGQLLGTLESVQLDSDGKLTHSNANISGSTSGTMVTLIIKHASLLSSAQNISGQIKGGDLVLNPESDSGGLGVERFAPASVSAFQRAAEELAAQGRRIVLDKDMEALTAALEEYASRASGQNWIPAIQERCTVILSDAHRSLALERSALALGTPMGRGSAWLDQGQINLEAGQLRMLIDQVRSDVTSNRDYMAKMEVRITRNACLIQTGVGPDPNVCAAFEATVRHYRAAEHHMASMSTQALALVQEKRAEMRTLEKQATITRTDQ